jgi:hypothetical protein
VVCRRAHLDGADADDLAQETWAHLLNKSGDALRRFSGRSAAETYFVRLVANVLVGMRRRRDGHWRPSRPVRRLGLLARELEVLVVRDRFTPNEAIEIVHARRSVSRTELEAMMERIVACLPSRRRARITSGLQTIDPQVDVLATSDPEQSLIEDELRRSSRHIRLMIEKAWNLRSFEEQLALAWRFDGSPRRFGSHRLSPAPAAFRKASAVLRDLLTCAGVGWAEASIALREVGLDLGLQELIRQANDNAGEVGNDVIASIR